MKTLRAREHGFTLIELLVAMSIGLLLLGGLVTFLVFGLGQQDGIISRAVASNQAESGLEELVRDLREAVTSVSISTSSASKSTSISFYIPAPGTAGAQTDAVTWTCPSTAEAATYFSGSCTRALTAGTGTTTTTPIAGVQSMLFSPVSSSNAALSLPVASATNVASVGMTLTVQITSHGLATCPTGSSCTGQARSIVAGAGNGAGTPSTAPIVLQATADLRNFA
jgi:type IV pilus assembly protein PilW